MRPTVCRSSFAALALVCFGWNLAAAAQETQDTPPKRPASDEVRLTSDGIDPAQRGELTFPDPASVTLHAKDGFDLSATYWAGLLGKKGPAVILLHDIAGSRKDVEPLAAFLQNQYGYAVIAPDLRGHGASLPSGDTPMQPDRMNRTQLAAIGLDIEACKKYLRDQNEEGKLNIDMLAVVAIGRTSIVAADWCVVDWSYPPLGGRKQGQDVKVLVLVSPTQSFKGLRISNALRSGPFSGRDVDRPLDILIAAGSNDPSAVKEATAIHDTLKRYRDTAKASGNLYLVSDYELNGAELAASESADLRELIGQLVFERLFSRFADLPWQQRLSQ